MGSHSQAQNPRGNSATAQAGEPLIFADASAPSVTWPLRRLGRNLSKRTAGRIAVVLDRLFGSRSHGAPSILAYHRITHRPAGVPDSTLNVTPRQFERQIAGLLARGFQIWPLRQILECRANAAAIPPHVVALTFDDGYENVYSEAWPILRKLRVPATIFVNTAYLDSLEPFPFDKWAIGYRQRMPAEVYRPLTTEQCHAMAASGLVELGSHTHTHQDLRNRVDVLAVDLAVSVEILRSEFGRQDVAFAFPSGRTHLGHVNEELIAAARGAGVTCALTTEAAPVDLESDPFHWGRFNAYAWDTAATLAAKCDGWYGWAPAIQRRLIFRAR
jgi:peptidoglycan/xylan/chitin deacetylase (PgdA/CDA1 family)